MTRTRTRYDGGCDRLLVRTVGRRRRRRRRRDGRRLTNPPIRILHDGRKIRIQERKIRAVIPAR